MIGRHGYNFKMRVFCFLSSNTQHCCHVNPTTDYCHHRGAITYLAKFDDETAKYRRVIINYMEKWEGGGGGGELTV